MKGRRKGNCSRSAFADFRINQFSGSENGERDQFWKTLGTTEGKDPECNLKEICS